MNERRVHLSQVDDRDALRDPGEAEHSSRILPSIPAESLRIHQGVEQVVAQDYFGANVTGLSMRDDLQSVETALPQLLQDRDQWYGLSIDEGRLSRLFRAVPGGYIFLHRTESSPPDDLPTYHYHQWQCAIHVLPEEDEAEEEGYEVGFGFGPGTEAPPVFSRIEIPSGGEFFYEMNHRDGWHYIKPLGTKPRWSVMVAGHRYEDRDPPFASINLSDVVNSVLSNERKDEMHTEFGRRFPLSN